MSAPTPSPKSITISRDRAAAIAFLLLLLGALAIALSPIFVRLSEIGPTTTAFWRVALAVPALVLWFAIEDRRQTNAAESPTRHTLPRNGRDVALLAAAGFLFAGDLAFWHWSIQYTSVANATLLANMAPIFVALASFVLFRERFTKTFLLGLATALAGAVILMSDSLTIGPDTFFGDILGIITALFYGSYIVAIGRLRAYFSTAMIMVWTGIGTAICLIPAALLSGEAFIPPSLYGWGILFGLSLISHAGGQSLIAYALAHLPAAFSSVSLLIQPVAAAILAWAILGEALGPIQALGAVVVLVGIYLARQGNRRVR